MGTVVIRDAGQSDLQRIADIYTFESENAYSTFETQARPLEDWLRKIDGPDPFLVALTDDGVVGFAYASAFRDRPAYHRTRETSIYLDRGSRRRGLGTLLYAALLDRLRTNGLHTALALIALPNQGSVRLHEQHGFGLVGILREVGDKQDRLIDVGIYQAMLAD